MIHETIRTFATTRAATWLAVVGFVLNLLSVPLHVALENHCLVGHDGGGVTREHEAQSATEPSCACSHDSHRHDEPTHDRRADASHRQNGPHRHHGGCGYEPASAPAVSAAGGAHSNCDCDSHCPHSIQDHVAQMKSDPTRTPSTASLPLLPILAVVAIDIDCEPLPSAPRSAEFHDLPPPDPRLRTDRTPRAPPTA